MKCSLPKHTFFTTRELCQNPIPQKIILLGWLLINNSRLSFDICHLCNFYKKVVKVCLINLLTLQLFFSISATHFCFFALFLFDYVGKAKIERFQSYVCFYVGRKSVIVLFLFLSNIVETHRFGFHPCDHETWSTSESRANSENLIVLSIIVDWLRLWAFRTFVCVLHPHTSTAM